MSPARRDGVSRRASILDAALVVFARKGVFAAGIEDVRKEAAASPSSLYHQFESIEDIVLALLERVFTDLFAHLERHVAETRTAEGAVVALVDGHLAWIAAHPDEGRFMYQAMSVPLSPQRTKRLGEHKAKALAGVVAVFEQHIEAGTLPRFPVIAFDIVLLGPAHEACRRWLAGAPLEMSWIRATLPALAYASIHDFARRA